MHQIRENLIVSDHRIQTSDGWNLNLRRMRPALDKTKNVILLVHGLAANSTIWNYRPGRGLAQFLAQSGNDVWVLDFRGHGKSAPTAKEKGVWFLEDFVDVDLPQAINFIVGMCPDTKIQVIGHSLGALVSLLSLGRHAQVQEKVKRLIAFSPSYLTDKCNPLWVRIVIKYGLAWAGVRVARILGYAPFRAAFGSMENESLAFANQLSHWALSKTWNSARDGSDFWQSIRKMNTPVYFLCSRKDPIWGRKESVEHIYELCGSDCKRQCVLEEELQIADDLGHYGMIMGTNAHTFVFPFWEKLFMDSVNDYARSLITRIWIILALVALGLGLDLLRILHVHSWQIWLTGIGFTFYSLVLRWFLLTTKTRPENTVRNFLWSGQFIDIIFLTVIIHFLGSYETIIVLVLYYTLIINTYTDRYHEMLTFLKANLCMLAFSVLLILEHTGFINHHRVSRLDLFPVEQLGLVAFGFLSMNACAIFKVHTEKRLRDQARQIALHNQTLEEQVAAKTRELRIAKESVQTQLGETRRAYDQLVRAEKLAALGTMVAGLSHEIFNPLNQISISVQNLKKHTEHVTRVAESAREDLTKKKWQALTVLPNGRNWLETKDRMSQMVDQIIGSVQRIVQLVQSIKDFSRTDEEISRFDFNQVIREVLSILEPLSVEKKVDIQWTPQPDLHVLGLRGPLSQVVMNLIKNALDALDDNGVIRLSTERDDGSYVFRIEDNGSGIPREHVHQVFEPFFTTKRPGQGTGLGLPISHRVVLTHEGEIKLDSVPGQGTCVIVTLPLEPPRFRSLVVGGISNLYGSNHDPSV